MPRAQAWTRCAPASRAQSALVTPRPRSWWPCQSTLTSGLTSSTTFDDERHQVPHAVGRRVSDRVADADAARSGPDRGRVHAADVVRMRAGRVLGDVHDREPLAHGQGDGVLRHPQHAVEVPVLGVLADRRGADEAGDLDRDPDLLRDLDDRHDVGGDGARRAVGPDLELARARSPGPGASRSRRRAGPAPGRPMSAESMPSASMRCRIRIFWSIEGLLTDGDCRPSRSVSSSSSTRPRAGCTAPPARFQS